MMTHGQTWYTNRTPLFFPKGTFLHKSPDLFFVSGWPRLNLASRRENIPGEGLAVASWRVKWESDVIAVHPC